MNLFIVISLTIVASAAAQLNETEIELIVDIHNYVRSKVANGTEDGKGNPLPKVANMNKLVWSEELAKAAEKWVATCPAGKGKSHDPLNGKKGWGENYFIGSGYIPLEGAISSWVAEGFSQSMKDCNYKTYDSGCSMHGHFTAITASRTNEIGCARKGCPKGNTFICKYFPMGNMMQQALWVTGEPCSQCADDQECEDSLCTGGARKDNLSRLINWMFR